LPLLENFPLSDDSEWPSLVDLANNMQVMMQSGSQEEEKEQNPRHCYDEIVGLNRLDQQLSNSFS